MSSVVTKSLTLTYNNVTTYGKAYGQAVVHGTAYGYNQILCLEIGDTNGGLDLTTAAKNILYPNSTAHPTKAEITWPLQGNFNTGTAKVTINGEAILSANIPNSATTLTGSGSGSGVTSSTSASQIRYALTKSSAILGYVGSDETRPIGPLTLYFTCYDFSATAGTGVTSASVSSSTGYDGDTIIFTAVTQTGYAFDGWYNGNTKVSSSQTYTYTVSGVDLSLTAKAVALHKNLLVQYDGTTIANVEGVTGTQSVTYNNTQIASMPIDSVVACFCNGKYMATALNVGSLSLNCANRVMQSDVNIYYGYTPLSYISTTGGAYINTGIIGSDSSRYHIEYDMQITMPSGRGLQGFGGSAAEYWGAQNGKYEMSTVISTVPVGNRDNIVWDYSVPDSNQTLTVNGAQVGSKAPSLITGKQLQLFAISGACFMSGKLYGCRVYVDGTLVRNYLPVSYNGVAGLYDTVYKTFVSSASSTPFSDIRILNMLNTDQFSLNNVSVSGDDYIFKAGTLAMITQPLSTPIAGHLYYGRCYQKAPAGSTFPDGRFEYYQTDGATTNMTFFTMSDTVRDNQWHLHSAIRSLSTVGASSGWTLRSFTVSGSADAYRKEMMIVDLTSVFGAGNEPTKEWCDTNLKFR